MEKERMKETLQALVEKEAWENISRNAKLTPEMIEQFSRQLDWNLLSENDSIRWTVKLVSDYKDEINWEALSENLFRDEETLNCYEHEKIVRKFPELLDWKVLSGLLLPTRKGYLRKFSDRWDWEIIAENIAIEWNDALFKEFEEKLLPILSTIMLENVADGCSIYSARNNKCIKKSRFSTSCTLLEQLIRKSTNDLKLKLLCETYKKSDTTLTGRKTVEEIIDEYF